MISFQHLSYYCVGMKTLYFHSCLGNSLSYWPEILSTVRRTHNGTFSHSYASPGPIYCYLLLLNMAFVIRNLIFGGICISLSVPCAWIRSALLEPMSRCSLLPCFSSCYRVDFKYLWTWSLGWCLEMLSGTLLGLKGMAGAVSEEV